MTENDIVEAYKHLMQGEKLEKEKQYKAAIEEHSKASVCFQKAFENCNDELAKQSLRLLTESEKEHMKFLESREALNNFKLTKIVNEEKNKCKKEEEKHENTNFISKIEVKGFLDNLKKDQLINLKSIINKNDKELNIMAKKINMPFEENDQSVKSINQSSKNGNPFEDLYFEEISDIEQLKVFITKIKENSNSLKKAYNSIINTINSYSEKLVPKNNY